MDLGSSLISGIRNVCQELGAGLTVLLGCPGSVDPRNETGGIPNEEAAGPILMLLGLFPVRTRRPSFATGATFTILTVRTARATGATGAARTAAAWRTSRAQFLLGEFAVPILVELQQGGRGVLDLARIESAVMIGVEGFHQWGDRPRPSIRTARTAGRLGAIFVLGDGGEGCASQSQRQQGAIQCFHSVSMVCVVEVDAGRMLAMTF
jgi:hypothetical protein